MTVKNPICSVAKYNQLPAAPLHRHNKTSELVWIESGTAEIQESHGSWQAGTGQLVLLPAGLWHAVSATGLIHRIVFCSAAYDAPQSRTAAPKDPSFVTALFEQMAQQQQISSKTAQAQMQLLLEWLWLELGPRIQASPVQPLDRVLHELEECCHLPFSLTETAAQSKFSKFHFSRQFKQHCGEAPLQFITRCRMERAQHLLQTTQMKPDAIASVCGYKSATQFHSSFTRFSGTTPKRFRDKWQKEQASSALGRKGGAAT